MGKRPEAVVDEQGAPWPPPGAAGAYIRDYGGDPLSHLNGVLVDVGPYVPASGMFEAYVTTSVPAEGMDVGDVVHCMPEELVPVSDYAAAYIKATSEAAFPVYGDEVYEVRDLLDQIGIAVTAESISLWSMRERMMAQAHAKAVLANDPFLPPLPKVLT